MLGLLIFILRCAFPYENTEMPHLTGNVKLVFPKTSEVSKFYGKRSYHELLIVWGIFGLPQTGTVLEM